MTIKVGDTLPETKFKIMTADGPAERSSSDLFGGRTVVLFAVPGAFTPTCHNNHLPGFVEHADTILSKGVDEIAVVSVNDVFVMNAWAKASGASDKITFLADGSADFAKAIGLELDASGAGLGIRSKRYAMIVKDGKVTALNIEETPGKAEVSGAAGILAAL
ncbi:peroxiredoxin [Stappia indica]|uniref:Glutathione-dependent peroxiredoxin n=1 Tax=Stappia indica TaxID=538381 RepID=A0A857CBN6_9HYPH|nr:peroxiredoxin [Stappia indica]QGZ36275.1 redoxin family protein [Stappia indica]